jgi:hypothetical protein
MPIDTFNLSPCVSSHARSFPSSACSTYPSADHSRFERVVLMESVRVKTGDFFHFLHHKYFECIYGGDGILPSNSLFGKSKLPETGHLAGGVCHVGDHTWF